MMAQPFIPTDSFYSPETPPKRSRLQECDVKPPFKTFKDQLISFDKEFSEPFKSSAASTVEVAAVTRTAHDGHFKARKIPRCLGRDSPLPLKNLGNTCYENSIIQCLFSLDTFMSNLTKAIDRLPRTTNDTNDFRYGILTAFNKLHKCYEESFQLTQDEDQRREQQRQLECRLEELKLAVGERSSQFNSAHQQDASEFFYHVIDSIQEYFENLNTDDNDNPVTQTFELELDYMMRCPKCHHKQISESEKIRTLPLALPHVNNQAPQSFSREEDVNRIPTPPTSDLGIDSPKSRDNLLEDPILRLEEKENQSLEVEILTPTVNTQTKSSVEETTQTTDLNLPDDGCQTNEDQQVRSQQEAEQPLYTLSDALNNYFKDDLLDLKCSQSNCNSIQRTKKCLIKKLPQVLFITLARYSYSGKKSLDEIDAPFELSVPFLENKSPCHSPSAHREFGEHDSNYYLVAVVCHLGSSLDAGHYTSYVFNQSNSSWYSCDDDSITKVQESEVRIDAKKSGYCFFYAHKSCVDMSKRESVTESISSQRRRMVEIKHDAGADPDCIVETSAIMTPESSPSPTTSNHDTSLMEATES